MGLFKSYNIYVNRKIRLLGYVVYPVVLIIASILFAGITYNLGGVLALLISTPFVSVFVDAFADRLTVGPIFAEKGKSEELLKSSTKGKEMIQGVIHAEMLLRLFQGVITFGGIVLVTMISGHYMDMMDRIVSSACLGFFTFYMISTLLIQVSRDTSNYDEITILITVMMMLGIPAAIGVASGSLVFIWILCGSYLIPGIIFTVMSLKSLRALVEVKWYED